MTKSRTNRRRRLNRARNYQRWLENTLHFQQTTLERANQQLQFRTAEVQHFWTLMGGPKRILVPKITEEREPMHGNMRRTLSVRRLRWDGFRLSQAEGELRYQFDTERGLEGLERDPEGHLNYQWDRAGSEIGVAIVRWLREQLEHGELV